MKLQNFLKLALVTVTVLAASVGTALAGGKNHGRYNKNQVVIQKNVIVNNNRYYNGYYSAPYAYRGYGYYGGCGPGCAAAITGSAIVSGILLNQILNNNRPSVIINETPSPVQDNCRYANYGQQWDSVTRQYITIYQKIC